MSSIFFPCEMFFCTTFSWYFPAFPWERTAWCFFAYSFSFSQIFVFIFSGLLRQKTAWLCLQQWPIFQQVPSTSSPVKWKIRFTTHYLQFKKKYQPIRMSFIYALLTALYKGNQAIDLILTISKPTIIIKTNFIG